MSDQEISEIEVNLTGTQQWQFSVKCWRCDTKVAEGETVFEGDRDQCARACAERLHQAGWRWILGGLVCDECIAEATNE
jgi:hypothetical protein